MDSFAFFNFVIKKDNKIFQFSVQPGTPWQEAHVVLDQFKDELEKLRISQESKPDSKDTSDLQTQEGE
jgi:hypothetical protein